MIFRAPRHKTGLSELDDRQVEYVRPIDTCGEMEGIFVDSSCDHKNRVLGSLQAYTYRCLVYVPNPHNPRYGQRTIIPYAGDCNDDEICVNGLGENQLRGDQRNTVDMAHCVKSEAYTRLGKNSTGVQMLEEKLGNATLDVTLSGTDQKTSLQADSINTESGVTSLGGAKGTTQRKSCIDCLDLDTEPLLPNTDFLETEVRVLSTGIAAGILWLTIWSG